MFIELTDHLRCPAPHEEAYLVLLPFRMEGRRVLTGHLGCPICGRSVAIAGGVADFGGAEGMEAGGAITPEAAAAFLGLDGPGGYLGLVGGAGGLAPALAPLLPGIGLVAINPPAELPAQFPASVLRAQRMPLKGSCLRGIVLGPGLTPDWTADAVRAVLPGLRIVGEGQPPDLPELEPMATGGEVWVGRRR